MGKRFYLSHFSEATILNFIEADDFPGMAIIVIDSIIKVLRGRAMLHPIRNVTLRRGGGLSEKVEMAKEIPLFPALNPPCCSF